MKQHSIEDLKQLFDTGERVDQELFAEMRSNILLVAGQHYTKRTSKFFARLRNTNRLAEVQKLRITKNHIHKITRYYKHSLLSKAPGVKIIPQNAREMQDKKDADLNSAVWEDAKDKYNYKQMVRSWAGEYVDIGEVCTKIFFDPMAGELKGYEPKMMGEEGGETHDYELDEQGQQVPDKGKPVFTGGFVFEPVQGFNLIRSPFAKTMQDSPWHCVRKMADKKDLKIRYAGDKEKLNFITDSEKETYVVFESHKAHYSAKNTELLIMEYYFRPCLKYPEGYFYITTDSGILEEGPLPFGIYPLVWEGFDEYPTTPRARSIIKVARPYQAEINRAASQMATHQITVGDDKVIYQSGTKLAPGALLPGVRGITFQGAPPQILPGRDGGQFLPYITSNIDEMYKACMVEEITLDESGAVDPYTLLFKSASQQQKFSQYTEKFENFLKNVCMKYLELAQHYLDDDSLIQAIGKREMVNIKEFKQSSKLRYSIRLEEQSENIESKLGKQLVLGQALQYVGSKLDSDTLGKMLSSMPYLKDSGIFDDLTLEQENAENDMLALERGEQPQLNEYADNEYYSKKLTNRMKQSDFGYLDPQIKQNYHQYLGDHQGEIQRKQQALTDAKNEYIPIGGALITCSMQIQDSKDPSQSKQVRLPYQALDWLINQLETQGAGLDTLNNMNQESVAQMQQIKQQQAQAQQPQLPQGPPQMGPPGQF